MWAVFQKLSVQRIHPLYIQITSAIVGLIVLFPIYIILLKAKATDASLNLNGVVFASLATLSGAIASVAYIFAIQKGDVGKISVLCSTYPLLTLVISVI